MPRCGLPEHELAEPTRQPNLVKAETYTCERKAYYEFPLPDKNLLKIILPKPPTGPFLQCSFSEHCNPISKPSQRMLITVA